MESIISKINNFIGNQIYHYDSDDENVLDDTVENINDIDQSTDFFGFFKKNIYEFGKKKESRKKKKKRKALQAEQGRNKLADSVAGQNGKEYNYSRLIRFTKKDPATGLVPENIQYDNLHINHHFAITDYGAFILYASINKYYNNDIEIMAASNLSIDDYVKDKIRQPPEVNITDNITYKENRSNPTWKQVQAKRNEYSTYKAIEGGGYVLDYKAQEGDKDGYVWIEARGPDNPPRLRYYKIMLYASDRDDPLLGSAADGRGYTWFRNQAAASENGNLAIEFNRHGLHVNKSRTDTGDAFWDTPGRVAAESWFPPIRATTATDAGTGGGGGSGGDITKFLKTYAIQQASYENEDIDKGVDTPDLFSNKLVFTLISSDDIDAAMMAKDDAEFDSELASQALASKQKEMLGALGEAFPADPLERLKSMFLYDNLLTIHLGGYHKGAGNDGDTMNPHTVGITTKPSFYRTITKVTPNHSETMTNFIEDVKDRTIYICSNVLLGISFCFLPYIKFPVLDALVHTLAYKSTNNQSTYNISRMPLTAKFTALFLSLQTSLITSLKTNAAPLCAVIGLSIITMTLPSIYRKPGKKDMDNVRTSWEGLATLNYFYMLIALFPPMAPNSTLEEALYSMFFPPGAKFDQVIKHMVPLIFMMILQSTFATDFLVLNIWFICMVPAVCLLLFPLFRTFARYVGGNMGNQAAGMIDKITDQLIEPTVNEKDSDTGLSMMELVTKVILVLAIFFIFAEFFDAVNDHFGLSNLITQMVNSFRNMTTIIPEILLVFFIVMTFSKAIKSIGAFNEQASATAKWDSETRQALKDGKDPAYAMIEYFFGALKDATLLTLGTITGKQDAYSARKDKEAKERENELSKEETAINTAAEKQIKSMDNEIEKKKIIADQKDALEKIALEREKIKAEKENRTARRAFDERRQKTIQDYELKRLQVAAKNDKEIGERQIEMAMLLGSGGNLGVSPLQIKQMMTGDAGFKNQMENAIKSGQDVTKLIKDQLDKSRASAAGMSTFDERRAREEAEVEKKKERDKLNQQLQDIEKKVRTTTI